MTDIVGSRDFLNSLDENDLPEDIEGFLDIVREKYGIAHLVYHAINVRGLTENEPYLRHTYPDDWVARYFEKGYFALDPVIEAGVGGLVPFNWNSLDWNSKPRRRFLGEALEHKIGLSGMSVPIRGIGGEHAILSVTSFQNERDWSMFLGSYMGDFQRIAGYIHQSIVTLERNEPEPNIIPPSPRERAVLQLVAYGLSTDAIADKLSIKERTVRAFLETSRYKLHALNRTHAVTIAIGHGFILPPT